MLCCKLNEGASSNDNVKAGKESIKKYVASLSSIESELVCNIFNLEINQMSCNYLIH